MTAENASGGTVTLMATFDITTDKGDATVNLFEVIEHSDEEDNAGIVTLKGKAVADGSIKKRFAQYQDAEDFFARLHDKYEKYASDIEYSQGVSYYDN